MNSISQLETTLLIKQFSMIEDPRIERSKKYPLINILIFSFIALLAGQESWYQMQMFCEETLDWFAEFLDISSGVPSHDTFRRVFSIINPEDFENSIIRWLEELRKSRAYSQRVVALDGKSVRGHSWKVSEQKLHILNAWDCTEQKFAGQLSIDCKVNEISAAPQLLHKLHLEKTVITVDAMMTQTEIARTIMEREGEYFMALKKNQKQLFEDGTVVN